MPQFKMLANLKNVIKFKQNRNIELREVETLLPENGNKMRLVEMYPRHFELGGNGSQTTSNNIVFVHIQETGILLSVSFSMSHST